MSLYKKDDIPDDLQQYFEPVSLIWGGDLECSHDFEIEAVSRFNSSGGLTEKQVTNVGSFFDKYKSSFCKNCGAWKGQLGLEPTPELYVEHIVEVFREVKRVLRDDGTLWLNLGISYAGSWGDSGHRPERTGRAGHQRNKSTKFFKRQGHPQGQRPPTASVCDKTAIQSPLLWRVPACGSGDKESQDSQSSGRVYPGCDDERQVGTSTRRGRTVRTSLFDQQDELPTSQIGRDNEPHDSDQALPAASLPGALVSTMPQSAAQFSEDVCGHEATGEACRQGLQTSSADVRASVDMSVCISGTSLKSLPLVVRTVGKESFFSACQSPGCRGIGRCGLCWCKLAIPSLNVKPKDEINIPHLVAMALQADGWYLRQDIIWAKPNPMPESVRDRCTKAHEYVFLLSKNARYYYDAEAIQEPSVTNDPRRPYTSEGAKALDGRPREQWHGGEPRNWKGSHFETGKTGEHQLGRSQKGRAPANVKRGDFNGKTNALPGREAFRQFTESRNRRSVWTIPTKPFKEAHYAVFPVALVEPMLLAGCPQGGIVLDLFAGSGTVAETAIKLGRDYVLIELNPQYVKIAEKRIADYLASLPKFKETILPGFEPEEQEPAPKRVEFKETKLL